MSKFLLILSISLILTACGGGSSGGSDSGDNDNTVVVSGVGATTNINESGKYNLTISGVNNIVTIRENNVSTKLTAQYS